MGRELIKEDEDRYLIERNGNFHYKRRVPLKLAHLDKRAPHVRVTLKTSDRKLARRKRDLLEEADDTLWASLVAAGGLDDIARRKFDAAVRRVEAMGYSFRPSSDFEDPDAFNALVERLRLAIGESKPDDVAKPLLGSVETPKTTVSEAFSLYCSEIVADELTGKSQVQRDQWKKVKQRAVNNFILHNSDMPMDEIAIEHAKKVYQYWLRRIAPKEGKATASFSSGNRDLGNMRVLYDAYFKHMGQRRDNPFDGLHFSTKRKKKRPPFPTAWIKDTILAPGKLMSLNEEARRVMLIIIETGARPSEICNLDANTIVLSHAVPHLVIEPREDPDDPREIKTESSRRKVPLVGVALEAAKKQASGFPRYKNRENDLSAALNKYFKENELFPSPAHKIYSLRHSFEDRMKIGGLDAELRKIIMGHAIDRPDYGVGGSLEWRQENLMKIALPFDPASV